MSKLFALAASAILLWAGPVEAAPVTYDFAGNFDAPATGSFNGSVTFDDATGAIGAVNVNVTAGKAEDGVTDIPGQTFTVLTHELGGYFFSFSDAAPATGNWGGFVNLLPGSLLSPSPTGLFAQIRCADPACTAVVAGPENFRMSTAVALTPAATPVAVVPTLSEWAMILFGLLLAGGATASLQRRRAA